VGGFLAGHATALRNDRAFLVSQGASKLVYYVGGILFLFVPGLHLTRGTGARTVKALYSPQSYSDYYMVLAAIAVSGAISFLLVGPLARSTIKLIERRGYRQISRAALAVVLLIVLGTTGWMGILIMIVGTGIGLIPVLFGSRRMNCLGIILLPAACNMSGVGAHIATWLGLL
jgi:putative membrane protein